MRYDHARKNLDRHPNYILAAYMGFRDLSTPTARGVRRRSVVPLSAQSSPYFSGTIICTTGRRPRHGGDGQRGA